MYLQSFTVLTVNLITINSICAPLISRLHVGAMVKVLDCHVDGRGFETRAGTFICQKKKYLALYLVVALMVPSAPSVVSMNSNLSWWSASLASSSYTSA